MAIPSAGAGRGRPASNGGRPSLDWGHPASKGRWLSWWLSNGGTVGWCGTGTSRLQRAPAEPRLGTSRLQRAVAVLAVLEWPSPRPVRDGDVPPPTGGGCPGGSRMAIHSAGAGRGRPASNGRWLPRRLSNGPPVGRRGTGTSRLQRAAAVLRALEWRCPRPARDRDVPPPTGPRANARTCELPLR